MVTGGVTDTKFPASRAAEAFDDGEWGVLDSVASLEFLAVAVVAALVGEGAVGLADGGVGSVEGGEAELVAVASADAILQRVRPQPSVRLSTRRRCRVDRVVQLAWALCNRRALLCVSPQV